MLCFSLDRLLILRSNNMKYFLLMLMLCATTVYAKDKQEPKHQDLSSMADVYVGDDNKAYVEAMNLNAKLAADYKRNEEDNALAGMETHQDQEN